MYLRHRLITPHMLHYLSSLKCVAIAQWSQYLLEYLEMTRFTLNLITDKTPLANEKILNIF